METGDNTSKVQRAFDLKMDVYIIQHKVRVSMCKMLILTVDRVQVVIYVIFRATRHKMRHFGDHLLSQTLGQC